MFYDIAIGLPRSVWDARILKSTTAFGKPERGEILVASKDAIQYVRVVSWNLTLEDINYKANATIKFWFQSLTSAKPASSTSHFLEKSIFGISKTEILK